MKKFALVCGASGAIGQEICEQLARDGWSKGTAVSVPEA